MGHLHHRRFYVPPEAIRNGVVRFSPAQTRQLLRVLRLRPGDEVAVFDGLGREYAAALCASVGGQVSGAVLGERLTTGLSPAVTLAQVIPRGGAFDQILAEATALGVARIIPLEATRSVRRPTERLERWLRIVQEAAEQSGRADLPVVESPQNLDGFLGRRGPAPLLVCQPGGRPLLAACAEFRGVPTFTLLLGGEGGLTPEELARMTAAGAGLVSLGPRLLRTATAATAALAIVQAALDATISAGSRAREEGRHGEHLDRR